MIKKHLLEILRDITYMYGPVNMAGEHIFGTYGIKEGPKKNRLKTVQRVVIFLGCTGFFLIMESYIGL